MWTFKRKKVNYEGVDGGSECAQYITVGDGPGMFHTQQII